MVPLLFLLYDYYYTSLPLWTYSYQTKARTFIKASFYSRHKAGASCPVDTYLVFNFVDLNFVACFFGLLHSEWLKLNGVLAFLSAISLSYFVTKLLALKVLSIGVVDKYHI